jgi:large subunit ribosomal protein L20
MTRVKGGPQGHLRHKKILKITKGQRGAKNRLFKRANEAMLKSLWYATRDRRVRKRDLRKLLKKANIDLNRKMLSDIAIREPQTFAAVVAKTK